MPALKVFFSFIILFLILVPPSRAEKVFLSRWAVDLTNTDSSLDRHRIADLAGLIVDVDRIYISNPLGKLDRRYLQTGELDWSVALEGPSQVTWTISGEDIFGGDTRGNLYCIRTKDGSIKWKATTKGVFFSKVLVGPEQVWVTTSNGTVQAYDRSTGQWLWAQSDPQSTTLALWSFQGPVLFQGHLLAGFPSALLQAFEPLTGKPVWKESFSASAMDGFESFNDLKSVSTDGAEILVASSYSGDSKVWKAQGVAKKLLWQKRLSLYAPATLDANDSIFLSARDGSVQSLETETGFVKWKHELSHGLGTQPSISGNHVWVGTSAGEIYAFSKEGSLLAKGESYESPIWNPPVLLTEDEALILTSSGILRRVRLVNR
ncbi:MAG: outer rane assembly lipoprotein YfgL [Bacteriovoracaceae bacterium]|nr:outer rane assembly lipoprotein YfgL [Bacteriovoracaceae bacterium]